MHPQRFAFRDGGSDGVGGGGVGNSSSGGGAQWVLIQNEGGVYELFLCVCLEIFDYCG